MHFMSFLYPLKPQKHQKTSLQTKNPDFQTNLPWLCKYQNSRKHKLGCTEPFCDNSEYVCHPVPMPPVSSTLQCHMNSLLGCLRNRHKEGRASQAGTAAQVTAYSLLHSEAGKTEDWLDYVILPSTWFLFLWPLTPSRTQGRDLKN